jgi:hypothetical protein
MGSKKLRVVLAREDPRITWPSVRLMPLTFISVMLALGFVPHPVADASKNAAIRRSRPIYRKKLHY